MSRELHHHHHHHHHRHHKHKEKKNIGQIVICTIVSFILSVFLTMSCYISGLLLGMFNTEIIIDALDNGTYYDDIIAYTINESENISILMGLPNEVYEEVFTVTETRTEVHKFVNSTIEGNDYTPATDKAKNRLVDNVNKYVVEGGYEINDEQQKNVDDFATKVCDVYGESMKIPFFKYFVSVRDVVSDVIVIALPILIVLSIAAVIVLIKAQKWAHKGLRYVSYATIASAIMTAGLPIYMLSQGIYKRISISPKYVYNFLVAYVDKSLSAFLWVSAALAIISMILMVVTFELRRSRAKRERKKIET